MSDSLLADIPLSLNFADVAISQQKNQCKSRLDAKIDSEVIKGVFLKVPMIAANMSTVTNAQFCIEIKKAGGMGVLHRAQNDLDYFDEVHAIARCSTYCAASIGVGEKEFDRAMDLVKWGANILVIDIAHSYSDAAIDMAKKLKRYCPTAKIVIGNTTNVDMLEEVADVVDALKVGIGSGLACSTKSTAGATEGQFTAVLKFKKRARELGMPIISDGGIREEADFSKALAAGASSIMAGSIFAACPSSAAETVMINDTPKKLYAGMASQHSQNLWKGGLKQGTCAEGVVRYLDVGDPVDELIERWAGALRSGITYGGGTDIKSFQDKVRFVRFK
jgi:IMP dehydrogenase